MKRIFAMLILGSLLLTACAAPGENANYAVEQLGDLSMDIIQVHPAEGIGALKLGLLRDEVEVLVRQMHLQLGSKRELHISDAEQIGSSGCYAMRYLVGDGAALFLLYVGYDENGKAVSISVDRGAANNWSVELYGLNVFEMEAEHLVEALKQHDICVFDQPDEQLSTQYTFPKIGIRLWREMAFHRKLLEDAAWMEEMSAVLEDEYEHLYFNMVTVFAPEYGSIFGYL